MPNIIKQKNPHPSRKHSARKKSLIIIVILLVVIGGSVGVWMYLRAQGQKQDTPAVVANTDNQVADKLDKTDQTVSDANNLADNGDINGAKGMYNNAIQQTSDLDQRKTLLIGEASTYYNDGDYDQALTIAKQAESISLDANLAGLIAEIYRVKGDTQNAILYYNKAIALTDKSNPENDHTLFYQGEIDGLTGVNN